MTKDDDRVTMLRALGAAVAFIVLAVVLQLLVH
jgi:hypothetical protein